MEQINILNSFLVANKLHATCISGIKKGAVVIFDIKIENDFRLTKFNALNKELMLTMRAFGIPTTKLNLDKGLLQVEMLLAKPSSNNLLDDLASYTTKSNSLSVKLGTSLKGEAVCIDLAKNPHMLIGGSTGSGKSAILHTIISNLVASTQAHIHIVDTKGIEFAPYTYISPNVKAIDSYDDFYELLTYLMYAMESRYTFLRTHQELEINDTFKPIVLVIDEFADLIMQDCNKQCYVLLCRLIQKCRAAGIYCILATQRPSSDIITGVIKANFPARLACKTASKTDARIILDQGGAENLSNVGEAILNNYKYSMEKLIVSYAKPAEIFNALNKEAAA